MGLSNETFGGYAYVLVVSILFLICGSLAHAGSTTRKALGRWFLTLSALSVAFPSAAAFFREAFIRILECVDKATYVLINAQGVQHAQTYGLAPPFLY